MQNIFECKQNISDYKEEEGWVNTPCPEICCYCESSSDCLRRHSFYTRSIFEEGEFLEIQVYRWICVVKKRTMSSIPSCIQPYLQLPTQTLEAFINTEGSEDLSRSDSMVRSLRSRLLKHNHILECLLGSLFQGMLPAKPYEIVTELLQLIVSYFKGLSNTLLELVWGYGIAPFGYYICHRKWEKPIRKESVNIPMC